MAGFPIYVQHCLQAKSCSVWKRIETWPQQTRHLTMSHPTDTQVHMLVQRSTVMALKSGSTCNKEHVTVMLQPLSAELKLMQMKYMIITDWHWITKLAYQVFYSMVMTGKLPTVYGMRQDRKHHGLFERLYSSRTAWPWKRRHYDPSKYRKPIDNLAQHNRLEFSATLLWEP